MLLDHLLGRDAVYQTLDGFVAPHEDLGLRVDICALVVLNSDGRVVVGGLLDLNIFVLAVYLGAQLTDGLLLPAGGLSRGHFGGVIVPCHGLVTHDG